MSLRSWRYICGLLCVLLAGCAESETPQATGSDAASSPEAEVSASVDATLPLPDVSSLELPGHSDVTPDVRSDLGTEISSDTGTEVSEDVPLMDLVEGSDGLDDASLLDDVSLVDTSSMGDVSTDQGSESEDTVQDVQLETDLGPGDLVEPSCGDEHCDATEDCSACPSDCGPCAAADCCSPHPALGCSDEGIAACVCDDDPFCCDFGWDSSCVSTLEAKGCGVCPEAVCGDGICNGDEDCASCVADCQACVCGNGQCEGDETCTSCEADCPLCGEQGCCSAHSAASCDDAAIATCVCEVAAYCCDPAGGGWDESCVEFVGTLGCGSCN